MNRIELDKLEKILKNLKHHPGVNPNPTFKKNARIRILNRISSGEVKIEKSSLFTPLVFLTTLLFSKPLRYALTSLLVFLSLGSGLIAAAQASSPSDWLYPIKVASEKAALELAPTLDLKHQIADIIVKRRLAELRQLEKIDRTHLFDRAEIDLKQSIEQAKKYGYSEKGNQTNPPDLKANPKEKVPPTVIKKQNIAPKITPKLEGVTEDKPAKQGAIPPQPQPNDNGKKDQPQPETPAHPQKNSPKK